MTCDDNFVKVAPKLMSLERYTEFNSGWNQLFMDLCIELEALIDAEPVKDQKRYVIEQAKEKFGYLTVYMSSSTTLMDEAIKRAAIKSKTTCEVCGKPGKMRGTRWFYTSCDEHSLPVDL